MKMIRYALFFLSLLCVQLKISAQNTARLVMDTAGIIYYTDLQHVWKQDSSREISIHLKDATSALLYINQMGILHGISKQESVFRRWAVTEKNTIQYLDTIKDATPWPVFSFDAKGNEYRYNAKAPSSFIVKKNTGADSIIAQTELKKVSSLYIGPKNVIYFTAENALYCIPPGEAVELIAKGLTDSIQQQIQTAYGQRIWSDGKKNMYITAGNQVKQIDHRRMVTTIYQSAGDWFPADGLITSNGDIYILEYRNTGEARVNKISMEERKKLVSENKWKGFYTPIILASIMMVLLFIVMKPKKKA